MYVPLAPTDSHQAQGLPDTLSGSSLNTPRGNNNSDAASSLLAALVPGDAQQAQTPKRARTQDWEGSSRSGISPVSPRAADDNMGGRALSLDQLLVGSDALDGQQTQAQSQAQASAHADFAREFIANANRLRQQQSWLMQSGNNRVGQTNTISNHNKNQGMDLTTVHEHMAATTPRGESASLLLAPTASGSGQRSRSAGTSPSLLPANAFAAPRLAPMPRPLQLSPNMALARAHTTNTIHHHHQQTQQGGGTMWGPSSTQLGRYPSSPAVLHTTRAASAPLADNYPFMSVSAPHHAHPYPRPLQPKQPGNQLGRSNTTSSILTITSEAADEFEMDADMAAILQDIMGVSGVEAAAPVSVSVGGDLRGAAGSRSEEQRILGDLAHLLSAM